MNAMKKKVEAQKWKVGDVFTIEFAPEEYAYGRILLDIYNQRKKMGD